MNLKSNEKKTINGLTELGLTRIQRNKIQALEKELNCHIEVLEPEKQTAKLSDEQYRQLQKMEDELGVSLVAYEPVTRIRLVNCSPQQLQIIREAENKLGLILVAYEVIRTETIHQEAITKLLPKLVELSEKQSEKLQKMEEETGFTLMAVKK
jgi:hypothetical protein